MSPIATEMEDTFEGKLDRLAGLASSGIIPFSERIYVDEVSELTWDQINSSGRLYIRGSQVFMRSVPTLYHDIVSANVLFRIHQAVDALHPGTTACVGASIPFFHKFACGRIQVKIPDGQIRRPEE